MKRWFALASILLLLTAVGVRAADRTGDFTFVQIADTQLGFTDNNRDLTPELENFRKAAVYINELNPAFVVISGDLINSPHNPKQIRAFWNASREISPDIPVYFVPGNHDIGSPTEANIWSYSKLFGPDHYAFSYGNSRFIVLDSCLIKETNGDVRLQKTQRKWFEEELAAARKQDPAHIFVLTHHPWFLKSPDEPDQYFNIPSSARRDYLDLMRRYGVDFALAGHYHREAVAKDGDLAMITTSAISKPLGKDPVGLRVFRVTGNRVEHTYHPL